MKKLEVNDPEAKSAEIVADNLSQLQALFPEAFSEGNVQFDVLRQLLGQAVDEGDEKFGLNWHGKRRAKQIALTPSLATLRPSSAESVEWETTQNLMIEGDNLEVLKLLQKSYAGRVKVIYLDPPYNTGGDFVYPDNFENNIQNYLELTGQVEGGQKISTNPETSGRFHTDWLNMMYPRIRLARALLASDGVIFVSINDREQGHLKAMMNEVFGEENFLAQLVWDKNHSAQAGVFKVYHEYVLVYARNSEVIKPPKAAEAEDFEAGAMKKESARHPMQKFRFPKGTRFDAPHGTELKGKWGGAEKVILHEGRMISDHGRLKEDVVLEAAFTQANQMKQFFYGDRESLLDSRGQKVLEFYFTATGKLKIKKERGVFTPPTVGRWGTQGDISTALATLFGMEAPPLETPKSPEMIQQFVEWFTDDGDIVMDFFAGSGTTGHAVMKANVSGGTQRRFILVQFPEPCDESSVAYKAGFKTIVDICKKRLVLAGKKVLKDAAHSETPDVGFRVFKLDTSNIKAWNPDVENLEQSLLEGHEHIVSGRTEADIVYELLLKLGLDLCVPMESRKVAGKAVSSVGGGVLMLCLAERVSVKEVEALATGIVSWHKELAPAGDSTVVFRDSAFADDVAKTNMAAILAQNGLENVRSL